MGTMPTQRSVSDVLQDILGNFQQIIGVVGDILSGYRDELRRVRQNRRSA